MNTSALIDKMDSLAKQGVWLFTQMMIAELFPGENIRSIRASITRHTKSGIIVPIAKGIYANERASSISAHKLEAVVAYLRPGQINYVSQETRLSELGIISQIPVSRLTVMTTGRSGLIETPYGTIELTSTKRKLEAILSGVTYDEERKILLADAARAYGDLKRARRNLDLVDQVELHDIITGGTDES